MLEQVLEEEAGLGPHNGGLRAAEVDRAEGKPSPLPEQTATLFDEESRSAREGRGEAFAEEPGVGLAHPGVGRQDLRQTKGEVLRGHAVKGRALRLGERHERPSLSARGLVLIDEDREAAGELDR